MTFKEKRDHKFKLLFMCNYQNEDIETTMSNYFENYPYDEENDNTYISGGRTHKNVAHVILSEDEDNVENESDKAITINLSEEDNIRDIKNKIKDIISKKDEIDKLIRDNLSTWDISRVGKAELTIIRLGVYEMYYDSSIDIPIAINEAVEMAKCYGDEKASKFVNGVLSTIYKNKKI